MPYNNSHSDFILKLPNQCNLHLILLLIFTKFYKINPSNTHVIMLKTGLLPLHTHLQIVHNTHSILKNIANKIYVYIYIY